MRALRWRCVQVRCAACALCDACACSCLPSDDKAFNAERLTITSGLAERLSCENGSLPLASSRDGATSAI